MLLFVLVLTFLARGSHAFEWRSEINTGITIYRCLGDDVTFPWNYVTSKDEHIIAVFWYSDKNGTFAYFFANRFLTSSDRVIHTSNAGMTLRGLTGDDVGIFGVHVKVYGISELYTQNARLVVVESPAIQNGELEVTEHTKGNNSADNQTTCTSNVQLKCGKFLEKGIPSVAVSWTDPDGNQLNSTDFNDGYFLLDLPHKHKGGNYTCSLALEPEAVKCLESEVPLQRSASFFLQTVKTQLVKQGYELKLQKTEIGQLKARLLDFENHLQSSGQELLEERVNLLESRTENLTASFQLNNVLGNKEQDETMKDVWHQVLQLESADEKQGNRTDDVFNMVLDLKSSQETHNDRINDVLNNTLQLETSDQKQDTTIHDVSNKVSQLTSSEERQDQRLDDVSSDVSRLKETQLEQANRIDGVVDEISPLKTTDETHNDRMNAMLQTLTTLQSEFETEIKELRQVNENQKTTIGQLQQRLDNLDQSHNDASLKNEARFDDVWNVQESLNKTIQEQASSWEKKLQASEVNQQQKVDSLSNNVESAVQTLNATLTHELTEQDERLQGSLGAGQKQLAERLQEARQSVSDRFRQLEVEETHHYEELKQKTQSLEREHDNLTEVVATLRDTFSSRSETSKQLFSDKLAEIEAKQKQNQVESVQITEDVDTRLKNITALLEEVRLTTTSELETLQTNMSTKLEEFEVNQKRSTEQRIQEDLYLKTQLNNLKETLSMARQTSASNLQTLHQNISTKLSEMEAVQEQNTGESQNLKAQFNSLSNPISTLQQETGNLEIVVTNLTSQLQRQNRTVEKMRDAIESRLVSQQTSLEELQEHQNRMKENVTDAFRIMQSTQERFETALQAVDTEQTNATRSLTAELSLLNNAVGDFEPSGDSEVSSLTSQLTELEQNLNSVQQECLKNKEAIVPRVATLESQLQTTRLNLGRQVNTTATTSTLVTSLSSQVSSLQQNQQSVSSVRTELQDFIDFNNKLHPIRLAGSSSIRQGRVEILVGKEWGTVCDDSWDNNDAKVVCAMLGFSRSGAEATTRASFGPGSGPIVLDDVYCDGSKRDIRVCRSTAFGSHDCGHSEDAGVVCR
ncbi:putative leucine-rich repeat-containing protein DDB_G0290503 [Littorina saxatilis]|uniref:putative leucine-rich repeat-containing protein DDB_G0290503 n=1 Tax=Littorina saxatilis TaxID=31220 RepID=UPI0038B69E40